MLKVGIVIPTIFERPQYLFQAIASIRAAGDAFILLASPQDEIKLAPYLSLVDGHLEELNHGNLATKINHALSQLPAECEFIGWLGDDDLLTENSLSRAVAALESDTKLCLVYGGCDYINAAGNKIGKNPSGSWAKYLMHFGPFLIPQPGSLWRAKSFNAVNGIDDSFELAFDHDLFLRMVKNGKAKHLKATQAAFRWHSGSLSVGRRVQSVSEASAVRMRQYPRMLRPLLMPWEFLVRNATKLAGDVVTFANRRNS